MDLAGQIVAVQVSRAGTGGPASIVETIYEGKDSFCFVFEDTKWK